MRWVVLGLIVLLAPSYAGAEDRVMLSPGGGYVIRWRSSADIRFDAFPRVERQAWSPVDRWFQVAPDGSAVAFWSAPTGFVVFAADGKELWRRKGVVFAFRFSPRGDRLAIATAREIEVFAVAQRESRHLATLAGVDWMRWTNHGLVARTRSAVQLIGEDGKSRIIAKLASLTVVAASSDKVVLFTPSTMREIDLAQPKSDATVTKLDGGDPVVNADVDVSGDRVLFATAKGVYLRAGTEIKRIAEVADVHSLSISPDGAAQVWVAHQRAAVVRDGHSTPLPDGTRSAHFRAGSAAGLVLTTEEGVFTWDPTDSALKLVGGISTDDGANITGDLVGGAAISFFYQKSGRQKELEAPRSPFP